MDTPHETWEDLDIDIPPGRAGEVKVLCPRCSHLRSRMHQSERCLSVNVDTGVYCCHHCDFRGALYTKRRGSMPYIPPPKPRVKPAAPSSTHIGETALTWFLGRGITEPTVRHFGIYAERHYFPDEGEVGALCFPFLRNGELANIKYRSRNKSFALVKDAARICYNLDAAESAKTVIWVEGEMDVLALYEAGVTNVISVPNGANSINEEAMDSARFLFDRKEVRFVLAVDGDEKGLALEENLAHRIGKDRCDRVRWPDGCKDANDVLVAFGPHRLSQCVLEASPYPVDGLVMASEVENDLWSLYVDGPQPGLDTGWKALSGYYSVRAGELTVVTGEPGSGKSAWVDNLAVNIARTDGWSIGVYSPENQPITRHIAMLMQKYRGRPFFEGPTERMDVEEVAESFAWVNDRFAFILPEEPTVERVIELARILVYRRGIKGLIIDPWNEVDHSRPPALTETEYISRSLTQIRQFARTHGVHVWIVAHPTKLVKGADGKYPVPSMYDIAGSGHWYNKADNGIAVERNKEEEGMPSVVHVLKIRFSEVGKLGQAELRYHPPTGRFLDIVPYDYRYSVRDDVE